MSTPADHHAPATGPDSTIAARVEELYRRHAPHVRAVCRSLLRDPVEAEDALQQTFLSTHRALLNGSLPRDPAAWLATIARHESIARVRARMRDPLPVESEERAAGPDAHQAAVQSHETGELRDALAELPAQQREAILLREVRGLSYQEVASTLSVTTSAVESLLFRARRTLQSRLREALAALTPAELVQPLRELAARLAGGGLAGPAVAKVAALGVGTAVVTGGAISGPTVLGLGHAPAPVVKTTHPVGHRASAPASSQVFAAPPAASPAPPVRQVAEHHPQQHVARVVDDRSNARSRSPASGDASNAGDGERSDGAGHTASVDGTTSSSAGAPESGDGGTQRHATSDSNRSRTEASDQSSGDASGSPSDTTTTPRAGSSED